MDVYFTKERLPVTVALIGGASLVVSSLIVAGAFYSTRAQSSDLTVTGSAKQAVVADTAKWTGNFSQIVTSLSQLNTGYQRMEKDERAVKQFFADQGIDPAHLTISPVFLDQPIPYGLSEQSTQPKEYTLRQTFEVQSNDVEKLTQVAKKIQPLIDAGVIFSANSLEYYYSKLNETRVDLLADAIQDARRRAEKITDNKVTKLKSASVGTVQVLPVNSIEISDYGTYDTSSINKEVMVTVKAVFSLK